MTADEYKDILYALGFGMNWSGHVAIARLIPNRHGKPINPRTSYRWALGKCKIDIWTAKYIKQLAKGV